MDREPCLWMQTGMDHEHLRSETVMVNGRPVKRRFPQRGTQGDYEDMRPAAGTRFIYVVNDYGNEVAFVLTCGAAHLDPTTGFGQYQMAQARFLGYYQPGQCPCALLGTGELKEHHIVSDEVRNGQPCAAGSFDYKNRCKHSLAEQKARQARSAEDYQQMLKTMDPGLSKSTENAQATVEAVQKLTAVVEHLASNERADKKK